MELNEKNVSEIAKELGLSGRKNVSKRDLDYLSSKSDAELEREILKIKERLKDANISYEQQMALLKNISPMLDSKQKARLARIIELLKK